MKASLQEIEKDLRQTRELAQERLEMLERIFEILRHMPEPDMQGIAAHIEEYLQFGIIKLDLQTTEKINDD